MLTRYFLSFFAGLRLYESHWENALVADALSTQSDPNYITNICSGLFFYLPNDSTSYEMSSQVGSPVWKHKWPNNLDSIPARTPVNTDEDRFQNRQFFSPVLSGSEPDWGEAPAWCSCLEIGNGSKTLKNLSEKPKRPSEVLHDFLDTIKENEVEYS